MKIEFFLIKKIIKTANPILLILVVLLNSCATTANYTEIVKSWEGADVNRLINSWGPPSDVYTMPNGNKMYTWHYVSNTLIATNYNKQINRIETMQEQYWCKTTFTVNNENIIISWRFQGNACRTKKK